MSENWKRLSSKLVDGKRSTARGMLFGLQVLKIIARILSLAVCAIGSLVTRCGITSSFVAVGKDKFSCSAEPESFEMGRNRHTEAFGSAVVSSGGMGADVKFGMISEPAAGYPILGVRRSNGFALL